MFFRFHKVTDFKGTVFETLPLQEKRGFISSVLWFDESISCRNMYEIAILQRQPYEIVLLWHKT
jgi:hypothetical protein